MSYFEKNGIPHSYIKESPDFNGFRDKSENSHVLVAMVRNAASDGIITTELQVRLKFDDQDSKLLRITFEKELTGP
jgi:hypothetical protein